MSDRGLLHKENSKMSRDYSINYKIIWSKVIDYAIMVLNIERKGFWYDFAVTCSMWK